MRPLLFTVFLLLTTITTFSQTPMPAAVPAASPVDPSAARSAATPAASPVPAAGYVRPDAKTRGRRYVKSMFGPAAIGLTVFSAGVGTATNSPEEWGGQWEGFGKRVASNFGRNMIRNTVVYGMDEALKVDSYFYRSEKRNFSSRVVNSLITPVTARNSKGKRVIGVPRLVGTYTSSFIATYSWYPDRYNYRDALRSGTITLGTNALYNLVREFIFKK